MAGVGLVLVLGVLDRSQRLGSRAGDEGEAMTAPIAFCAGYLACFGLVSLRDWLKRKADALNRRPSCGNLVAIPNSHHAEWCQDEAGHEGQCSGSHWDNSDDCCWCEK